MKCFRTLSVVVLLCLNLNVLFSQNTAPEGIYYQAVARDDQGNELVSENLNLQISIREGEEIIYTENHTSTSDQFGLFELVIGNGSAQTILAFSDITWFEPTYFLVVALDSGDGYEILSETQLLSVPYSIYSTTALNVINDNVNDADADSSNELVNSFQIVEDSLKLTEAGTIHSVALSDIVEDNDWTMAADSAIHNSDQTNKVGINTTAPTSTLSVNGSLALGITNTGSNFTPVIEATINETVILCNVTGGAVQVNLPDAAECAGRVYFIKKFADNNTDSASSTVTVAPAAGQNIDFQSFRTLGTNDFREMTIISDGSNWFILSRSGA